MSDYVTPELIERAARAAYEDGFMRHALEAWTFEDIDDDAKESWRVVVDAALTAVLPEVIRQAKSEAWDEGHAAGCTDPYAKYGECGCGPNPYRADRIEQGGDQ